MSYVAAGKEISLRLMKDGGTLVFMVKGVRKGRGGGDFWAN